MIRDKSRRDYYQWHRWYAWHPVDMPEVLDGSSYRWKWVWLEWIWRRKIEGYGSWSEYRLDNPKKDRTELGVFVQ